jgi:FPC/CPF motif-containing protein YcgG
MKKKIKDRSRSSLKIIEDEFRYYINDESFPCVGAKSSLAQSNMKFYFAQSISDSTYDDDLHGSLKKFGQNLNLDGVALQSYVVIFSDEQKFSEIEFERLLWRKLQSLHDIDISKEIGWSKDCESLPQSPKFSMSIAGYSFFIIGTHSNSSRSARKFKYPAMVFNSHAQFEILRKNGKYEKLQKIIRQKELEINGSINPMVKNFGEGAEASQYSGRHVDDRWKCPIKIKRNNNENN